MAQHRNPTRSGSTCNVVGYVAILRGARGGHGGELEVGNGRIKYSSAEPKYCFDADLGDVLEAKIDNDEVVIRSIKGKKFKFYATDRLGHIVSAEPLLDAVLQAMGK